MNPLRTTRTAAVLATAAVAATCLISSAQAVGPSTTVTVRQSDLITALSDTRSAGHVTFLGDGVGLVTDDSTSNAKAAEYFPMTGALPDSASTEWYGTQPQPGQQIVFDADGISGNNNDYNVLVGEPAYGDNWWLTNGSSADAKAADPSGANDSGNGSAYFGTLAEWKAALPDARILAGGFSLGSGVKGSGVIRTMTYGNTLYRFTDAAAPAPVVQPPAVNVHGSAALLKVVKRHAVLVRVALTSQKQPADTVMGSRLGWRIQADGVTVFSTHQQFDDQDVWSARFANGTGKHVVKVFMNGQLVRRTVVRTGS